MMVSGWDDLHLSPAARQFQQEMRQLYSRYAAMQGSRTCLMGIFLTDTTDLPGPEHPSSPGERTWDTPAQRQRLPASTRMPPA